MPYLSNAGKMELSKWDNKGYFPMNSKLIEKLKKIDINYSEVVTVLSDFFKEHEELIKSAQKIIHKQGFDSFYVLRTIYKYSGKFNKESETQFLIKLLKSCIGKVIILFIVVEPLSLVLADDDLSARFNFDSLTQAVDIEFFRKHLSGDIIEKIKNTTFFKEFSSYFASQEKMSPATFDVVKNNAFDINLIEEIENQRHLLNLHEQLILEILKAGIKLSHIYPDCNMLGYFTSISSNYHATEWHSIDYAKYLKVEQVFNQPYHNIYRSVIQVFQNNWIFEHNEIFCWTLFFVCIRSALEDVNTQILLPAYSFTADRISSDFPYEVGAITETVSSFLLSKKWTSEFCCSLRHISPDTYCSVKASFHSLKKFLLESSM